MPQITEHSLPKISIVTPSLNQGHFIEDAILSVQNQGYPNFEHIVVDGGSNDGTIEILKRYRHLQWLSERDSGQSDAINKGFRIATGDIVAWCNTDDEYLPGAFMRVAKEFLKRPETDILYGEIQFISTEKHVIRHKREHRFDFGVLLYYGCYIPSAASFFSRRIIENGDLLDLSYRACMDYEFFVRLAKKGYNFHHLKQVLASFRLQEGNAGKIYEHLWKNEERRTLDMYTRFPLKGEVWRTLFYNGARIYYTAKRQFLRELA